MTVSNATLETRNGDQNAIIRRLYREFPQVPAGAVADAVHHAWRDVPSPAEADTSTSVEVAERTARERLQTWRRRADLAAARVHANRRSAAAPAQWRISA
jgi:hypothetical protein